ncbi:IS1595 family transposase [Candidatus Poribacteria bacterium]|nr:IS1595 family transposase [Candidatus Poribacteria bacterium]
MNLIDVMERFPDQEACIAYLEEIRWKDKPECPHCQSQSLHRREHETETGRIGRWNCQDCEATFRVLHGTLFHGTKIPLQKWFLAIALIVNAKKSISSYQLQRDLGLNQKTAWFMQVRIRAEMADKAGSTLLKGIVEADETYIGGKPRKPNKKDIEAEPNKRGRGTDKVAILGAVARGGDVVAQLVADVSGRTILDFIQRAVKTEESTLITDEFRSYHKLAETMKHEVINHSEQYVDGDTHTNTIEGFSSLLKRAWYGTHHHYTTGYTPLYVAEQCYVYNNRHRTNIFWKFLRGSMQVRST